MAGLSISKKDIMKAKRQVENLKRRASKALEQAEDVLKVGVRTAEVGAAAFGLGVLSGKTQGGMPEVVGVPIDLGAGAVLHTLGFLGVGGDLSEHMHNFGDGALASYLVTQGVVVGDAWKKREIAAPADDS